ncbi:MAG TPA: mechanosensitive ion channel domain-containing protein [Desulfuromonadaceae bacterium]|nr:mechanosensitive ion channel domain-containing protein [Desulfuromonadaceae bacterium]
MADTKTASTNNVATNKAAFHGASTNSAATNGPAATNAASTHTTATNLMAKVVENPHVANFWQRTSALEHIGIILAFAVVAHMVVKLLRHASEWLINRREEQKKSRFGLGFVQQPKFVTLTRLIVSGVTFGIYFLAIGLILILGFHLSDKVLTTYLSSAAVVGLAVSFGLQGLIQDVVTGVTLILSNTMDVGDRVDLSGVIGRVERIGLRYTKLVTFYNQQILIPNRNITNITRFPHGGILAYADVQIPARADQQKALDAIRSVANGMRAQFNAIVLSDPEFGNVEKTPGDWNYVRVQFHIWPGQNNLIETNFRQQMVAAMKACDPNYADWQVVVTYRAMTGGDKG